MTPLIKMKLIVAGKHLVFDQFITYVCATMRAAIFEENDQSNPCMASFATAPSDLATRLDRTLLNSSAVGGPLNAPWGVAIAPSTFGAFAGDVLVGNFGDGTINAFDPKTGASLGALADENGNTIALPGLLPRRKDQACFLSEIAQRDSAASPASVRAPIVV